MSYPLSTIFMSCPDAGPGGIFFPRYPNGVIPATGLGAAVATDTTSAAAALSTKIQLTVAAQDTTSGVANLVGFGFTTTTPLPSALVGTAYSVTFATQGGTPPVNMTESGSVPGLTWFGGAESLALTVVGSTLVNGSGTVTQLRGANMSGLENSCVQGNQPWADDNGVPNWTAYETWQPNAVRIPLHSGSWLGLTTYNTTGTNGTPTWGAAVNNDPFGNYKAAVIAAAAAAQAIGCYVIFDLHWTAPQFTLGGVTHYLTCIDQQPPFANSDTDITFWTEMAQMFGTQATPQPGVNNNAIIFELFNEPFLDSFGGTLSAGNYELAMRNGGTSSQFPNGSQGGTNFTIAQTWNIAGYQAMLTAIRGTGAKNICVCNGGSYAQELEHYATYLPTDTLNPAQLACGWHPYPAGGATPSTESEFPKTGNDAGGGTAAATQWANAVIATGIPVMITEDGGCFGPDTSGEPHITFMQDWAASEGAASYIWWQWNLVQASGTNGQFYGTTGTYAAPTPTQGQGQVCYNWMTGFPAATTDDTLSGVPTAAGNYNVTVTATDSSGSDNFPTIAASADNEGFPNANVQAGQGGNPQYLTTDLSVTAAAYLLYFGTVATFAGTHTEKVLSDTLGNTFAAPLVSLVGPAPNVDGGEQNNTQETDMWGTVLTKGGADVLTQNYGTTGDLDYQAAEALLLAGVVSVIGTTGQIQGNLAGTTGVAAGLANGVCSTGGTQVEQAGAAITVTAAQVPCLMISLCCNLSVLGTNNYTPTVGSLMPGTAVGGWDGKQFWKYLGTGAPAYPTACLSVREITAAGTYTAYFNNPSNSQEWFQTLVWMGKGSLTPPNVVTETFALTVESTAPLTMYANGVINRSNWPAGNDYTYNGTDNYLSTAQVEDGHTYSLALTSGGSPPSVGWQQATNWAAYPPNGLDISGYTWLEFDIYSPWAASVYGMLAHYTRSTGDDIAVSTGVPNMANVTTFPINSWLTGVRVPLSSLGMLDSYNYYKYAIQEYGQAGTFYLDNVQFIAGPVAWVYRGTGALVSGWTDASTGVTVNYGVSPQSLNAALYAINNPATAASEFTGSITGTTMAVSALTGVILDGQTVVGSNNPNGSTTVVSGSGATWTITPSQTVGSGSMSTATGQAAVNILSLSFTSEAGVWRTTYGAGFSIADYEYFTFGAIPTKTPYAYLMRIYNTQGAQIGNSVNPASYTLNDFGVQLENFTVYNVPLSAFALPAGTTTIGGVSIEDNTTNTTNLVYLSAVGFFS